MTVLTTRRLALLPLSRAMLQTRLERDDFDLVCRLPAGARSVHFPPSWPGDPLPAYPGMLAGLVGDELAGSFAAVELATSVAVGALGTVGPSDDTGAQEIGYGFNPDVRRRGLATEAVAALVAHLLTLGGITAVVADTAVANRASERVLEKTGFVRVGTGHSDEDGDLTKWRYATPITA